MFHSCDELPLDLKLDDDKLLLKIQEHFTPVRKLGEGATGIVFEMIDNEKKTKFALKVAEFNYREISINCKINSLTEKALTSVFSYTHGWAISNIFPDKWYQKMKNEVEYIMELLEQEEEEEEEETTKLLYFSMDIFPYRLMDILVDDYDIRSILFLIIHGIAAARKELGSFGHQDLHPGNIMIMSRNPNDLLKVNIGDEVIEIRNLSFMPKIIDFGQTLLRKTKGTNDFREIRTIFRQRYEKSKIQTSIYEKFSNGDLYMEANNAHNDDYQTLFTLLLEDPFFKIDNIRVVTHESYHKKLKPNNSCISCGSSNPTVMYAKNSNYIFCNVHCEKKYSGLHDYLPSK